MKINLKSTAAIAVAAILATGSVYAMGPGWGGNGPKGPPPIEQLQDRLDLSDTQVQELTALFEAQREKRRTLRKERRVQREQMQQQLAEILSPTQLEDMMAIRGCERNRSPYKKGYRMQRDFW